MFVQNNPQMASATSFKAIKSVKCEGLYKKFPEEGKKLVDAFKNNSKAMDFCKKYDVNVVFYAVKEQFESVASSLHIFFKNPAKTKFFGLIKNADDKISLSVYDYRGGIKESLEKSTARLKDYITENIPGKTSGVLDSHIHYKQEEISEYLAQKSKKEQEAVKKANLKNQLKSQKISAEESLKESIENLVNNSK
jgi:LPS O-antigen subunit length determinant protein (WzzB/FepE family)